MARPLPQFESILDQLNQEIASLSQDEPEEVLVKRTLTPLPERSAAEQRPLPIRSISPIPWKPSVREEKLKTELAEVQQQLTGLDRNGTVPTKSNSFFSRFIAGIRTFWKRSPRAEELLPVRPTIPIPIPIQVSAPPKTTTLLRLLPSLQKKPILPASVASQKKKTIVASAPAPPSSPKKSTPRAPAASPQKSTLPVPASSLQKSTTVSESDHFFALRQKLSQLEEQLRQQLQEN